MKEKSKKERYDILHLPKRLFKYYSFNEKYNNKRFLGDVYFASPFDFNDPCDCQREVVIMQHSVLRLKVNNGWILNCVNLDSLKMKADDYLKVF